MPEQRFSAAPPQMEMVSNDQSDEVDYSFSRLPVRERRKMFQTDETRVVSQYGTLPRGFQHQQQQQQLNSQMASEANAWQSPVRPAFLSYTQAQPRRNSIQEYRTVPRQYLTPSYATARQSRPIYKSQVSTPTLIQAGDQPQLRTPLFHHSPSPSVGTRVFRRASYAPMNQSQRDSMSTSHEIWPSRQQPVQHQTQQQQHQVDQYGQPLCVRVYNCDRSASSPGHSQTASYWEQASPAYAAYPAYGPRPANGGQQIYRVVPGTQRAYPQTISSTGYNIQPSTPQPTSQIYVPLSPVHRRTCSTPLVGTKTVPVYQTMRNRQQYPTPTPPPPPPHGRSDWTVLEPTKLAPVSAKPMSSVHMVSPVRQQPMMASPPSRVRPPPLQLYHQQQPYQQPYQPHHQRSATLPNRPRPKVVNRRTPPPDNDLGVTEF